MKTEADPVQTRKNENIQNLKKISEMADALRELVEEATYFPDRDELEDASPDRLAEWLDDALVNNDGIRPGDEFHRHLGDILEHVSFCHGLKFMSFWRKAFQNLLSEDETFSDHPAIDKECLEEIQEALTNCETQLRASFRKRDKAIEAEER